MDIDAPSEKRGPGRPPGSPNRPKLPRLSLEQAAALRKRLASAYAEAVTAQALATDRKRRLKTSIKAAFGEDGLLEVEQAIEEAENRIVCDTAILTRGSTNGDD